MSALNIVTYRPDQTAEAQISRHLKKQAYQGLCCLPFVLKSITKVLNRLCRCVGCSVPLLFPCN